MIKAAERDRDIHQANLLKEKPIPGTEISSSKPAHAHTLYHYLLSSSMPDSEKLPRRMAHEGFEILLAGSDTTARTMGIAAYHVMANPPVAKRLLEELKTVMPGPHSPAVLKDLEALPYLVSEFICLIFSGICSEFLLY
jgi:cytochrome P450